MALQPARHSADLSQRRWMAKQFMTDVERACEPFQFALSTRAGADCVGHAVRVVTDHDPKMTVVHRRNRSLRSRVSKLHSVETARSPQSPFHVAVLPRRPAHGLPRIGGQTRTV